MKRVFLIFFIVFNIIHAKTVILASDDYPPFVQESVKGLLHEIVEESFKIEDYDLKIVITNWNRAYEMAVKGNYDGLIGLYYSKERDEVLVFSEPIINNQLAYFSLGSSDIKKDSIFNYKIGIVKGYSYSKEFNNNNEIFKIEALSGEDNIKALINKRVDLILESKLVVKSLLKNKFPEYENKVTLVTPFLEKPLYIALTKKQTTSDLIIKDFNKGLNKIKKNGTYDNLLKKHGFKQ